MQARSKNLTMDNPQVSVLLPVHNAVQYLHDALTSLADQTLSAFEVIAVDDGSTDGSYDILESFARDHKWLSILRQKHAGIAISLNHAFAVSRGPLVARMDADDIAEPTRLALQMAALKDRPEVGVCGSWIRTFGNSDGGVLRLPISNDAIRARLVFGSALAHPAVMMKREVLNLDDGPYKALSPPVELEDYSLWLSLADRTCFFNIPKPLLRYRQHSGQVTMRQDTFLLEKVMRLRMSLLERQRIDWSDTDYRIHAALGSIPTEGAKPPNNEIEAWLGRLQRDLPMAGWCSETAINFECGEAWWRLLRIKGGGANDAMAYWRAIRHKHNPRTLLRFMRLALRRGTKQPTDD
jgi:glycosyltransferase involved in cell wall biosynthesis